MRAPQSTVVVIFDHIWCHWFDYFVILGNNQTMRILKNTEMTTKYSKFYLLYMLLDISHSCALINPKHKEINETQIK
jgi:hypothetical protein